MPNKPLLASELIAQLTIAIKRKGDVPVRIWDEELNYALPCAVTSIPEKWLHKYPELTPSIFLHVLDIDGLHERDPSEPPDKRSRPS